MQLKSAKLFVLQHAGLLGVLGILSLIFGLGTDSFFRFQTLGVIGNQIPDLTLVAVGMTFVLIIGGIDLSVGSILALSSAALGSLVIDYDQPLLIAIIAAIFVGSLCGAVNGFISVKANIPSFIVTLSMLEIARGLTKLITNSETKYIGSVVEPISNPITSILFSPAFLFAVTIVIASQFVLRRTIFGRYCIAIGTNEDAVRLSGINVVPYKVTAFVICGMFCGIAGIFHAAKLSTADPNAAVGMELSAIAACVIGGTSLMGGRGNVSSTFLGVLIIATLQTGLATLGVSDPIKQIITGSVILIAVISDALRQRWS
ncbi:MAG: ABC transporter permease [Planctomycetota bacterium]|nr:ABC transporter permease [Planctomycetota bacterium]